MARGDSGKVAGDSADMYEDGREGARKADESDILPYGMLKGKVKMRGSFIY
jgi:hypothetical protein